MESLSFVKQYIKKPRNVGAILPSSKYLAAKMIKDIDFIHTKYIVEYGPGTGVFTRELIKNRKPDTIILLFECNKEFCKVLTRKYKDEPNLYIISDSAEYIGRYLDRHGISSVDYIVSGLPFASLPHDVSTNILEQTQKYLKEDGKFITFQYTLLKRSFIGQYFNRINIKREFRNVPPAYVFCCSR